MSPDSSFPANALAPAPATDDSGAAPRFLIYARSYCHLCDDMRDALLATFALPPEVVAMIDVDADEALVAQYDELVPVLMGRRADGALVQLCHYHLDAPAVAAFLAT